MWPNPFVEIILAVGRNIPGGLFFRTFFFTKALMVVILISMRIDYVFSYPLMHPLNLQFLLNIFFVIF